jgi:hypothetical protein
LANGVMPPCYFSGEEWSIITLIISQSWILLIYYMSGFFVSYADFLTRALYKNNRWQRTWSASCIF